MPAIDDEILQQHHDYDDRNVLLLRQSNRIVLNNNPQQQKQQRSLLNNAMSKVRIAVLLVFVANLALVVGYHHHLGSGGSGSGSSGGERKEQHEEERRRERDNIFSSTTTTESDEDFWERIRRGPSGLVLRDKILFGALILMAFELLDFLTFHSGKWFGCRRIPVRGKHLDDLTTKDLLFIGISKAGTAPFVYFYLCYAYRACRLWELHTVTAQNTLFPLVPLFVLYDLFYTLLHWFLHLQFIYAAIHKHHHVQKAPSRANVDAVNVHPVEFVLGEYNHLFVLYLCTTAPALASLEIHVLGAVLFLIVGGFLAGYNHTRYDIVLAVPNFVAILWPSHNIHHAVNGDVKLKKKSITNGKSTSSASSSSSTLLVTIYDSKAHDVHHRIPQCNYGQYTTLWDRIFGTYRPYREEDRVNPYAQLDPATGKTTTTALLLRSSAEAAAVSSSR